MGTAPERTRTGAGGTRTPRTTPTARTTSRDKKELLRTLLDEVVVSAPRGVSSDTQN